jgi:hypothetical protein
MQVRKAGYARLREVSWMLAELLILVASAQVVTLLLVLAFCRAGDDYCSTSAPSRIRTCGLLLRRESLCPAELSGQGG